MQSSAPPPVPDRADRRVSGRLSDTPAHLEKIGRASIVVLASLFALGLLVTNAYLLQFGLSEFGLLRARFVLTGLLASFSTVLNVSSLVLAYVIAEEMRDSSDDRSGPGLDARYLSSILIIGVALPIAILGVVFRRAEFTDSNFLDALLIWAIGFLPILPFAPVTIVRWLDSHRAVHEEANAPQGVGRSRRARFHPPVVLTMPLVAIGLLFFGYLYIDLFSRHIYPNVPEQFGGGMPYEVQLLFRADSVEAISQMHIPIVEGSNWSQPVTMLWHGDSGILVRINYEGDDDVVLLDGSLVTAIALDDD